MKRGGTAFSVLAGALLIAVFLAGYLVGARATRPSRPPSKTAPATAREGADGGYARDGRFGILIPKGVATSEAPVSAPTTASSSGGRPRVVEQLSAERLADLATTLTARAFGVVKGYTTASGSLSVEVAYFYAIPEGRPRANDATLTAYSLPRGSIVTGVVPLAVREQGGVVPPAGTPVLLTLRLVPGARAGFVEIRSLEVLKPPEGKKKG